MSRELPRVEVQPVVRDLYLIPVDDLLLEDTVSISQTVAPGGVIQGGQGVQETRSQATQPTIAQGRIMLLLNDILDAETQILEALYITRIKSAIVFSFLLSSPFPLQTNYKHTTYL